MFGVKNNLSLPVAAVVNYTVGTDGFFVINRKNKYNIF